MTRQTPRPLEPTRHSRLGRDRRGSIALMTAILVLPLIGMVGLAIDFATYSQTNSALTAAARAAVLNAVKIAAAGAAAGNATYVRDGQDAGVNWFLAQSGKTSLTVSNMSPSVIVTPGTTITATLTATALARPIFGAIFGVKSYKIGITTQAQETLAPFVEIIMFLDNSSSMGIGAGAADIATMMRNSPCDPSNEFTSTDGTTYSNIVSVPYSDYLCTYNGTSYDGQNSPWNAPTCPFNQGNTTYSYQSAAGSYTSANSNFTCPGLVTGHTVKPGEPCAFACHSDGTKPAGLGNDLWAMARKNGVTLRSDLLKNAAQQMISAMKTRDPGETALSLGVYTFDTVVTPIYPPPSYPLPTDGTDPSPSAEAGRDWTTASAAVGWPPAAGHYDESGIQPVVAKIFKAPVTNNSNTLFEHAMTQLHGEVTAAGSGATATAPRKALILITDGVDDLSSTNSGAMPFGSCQQFKDLGYQVYVLYTSYYPLMHKWYLAGDVSAVEGTDTDSNSVTYNLQNCSSRTGASDLSSYYVQVTDQAAVTNALQRFLTSAISSPARYTE